MDDMPDEGGFNFDDLSDDDFNFAKIASFNEMLELMDDIAKATNAYYCKLIAHGFPPEAALAFTLDWHRAYWTGEYNPPLTIVNEEHEHLEEPDED